MRAGGVLFAKTHPTFSNKTKVSQSFFIERISYGVKTFNY